MSSTLYTFCTSFAQDRRLISEPGADLECDIGGVKVEEIGHQRDNKGLRDRLVEADRKRRVGVRKRLDLDGARTRAAVRCPSVSITGAVSAALPIWALT
jgi:hypothetical protein